MWTAVSINITGPTWSKKKEEKKLMCLLLRIVPYDKSMGQDYASNCATDVRAPSLPAWFITGVSWTTDKMRWWEKKHLHTKTQQRFKWHQMVNKLCEHTHQLMHCLNRHISNKPSWLVKLNTVYIFKPAPQLIRPTITVMLPTTKLIKARNTNAPESVK